MEEQIVLVLKAKVQCELNITAQPQGGGKGAENIVSPCVPTSVLSKTSNSPLELVVGSSSSLIACFYVEEHGSRIVFFSFPSLQALPFQWTE